MGVRSMAPLLEVCLVVKCKVPAFFDHRQDQELVKAVFWDQPKEGEVSHSGCLNHGWTQMHTDWFLLSAFIRVYLWFFFFILRLMRMGKDRNPGANTLVMPRCLPAQA